MILNDVDEFELWTCPSCRGITVVEIDENNGRNQSTSHSSPHQKKYVTKSCLQKQVNQAKKESSQEGNSYYLAGMYIIFKIY